MNETRLQKKKRKNKNRKERRKKEKQKALEDANIDVFYRMAQMEREIWSYDETKDEMVSRSNTLTECGLFNCLSDEEKDKIKAEIYILRYSLNMQKTTIDGYTSAMDQGKTIPNIVDILRRLEGRYRECLARYTWLKEQYPDVDENDFSDSSTGKALDEAKS